VAKKSQKWNVLIFLCLESSQLAGALSVQQSKSTQDRIGGFSSYKMEKNEMFKKAEDLWGFQFQLEMLIEESAELIQATTKWRRNWKKYENQADKIPQNFIEELADVQIMLQQIRISCARMQPDFDNDHERHYRNKMNELFEMVRTK